MMFDDLRAIAERIAAFVVDYRADVFRYIAAHPDAPLFPPSRRPPRGLVAELVGPIAAGVLLGLVGLLCLGWALDCLPRIPAALDVGPALAWIGAEGRAFFEGMRFGAGVVVLAFVAAAAILALLLHAFPITCLIGLFFAASWCFRRHQKTGD